MRYCTVLAQEVRDADITVQLPVFVRTAQGRPVPGLGANDFILAEGGIQDVIISVEQENGSASAVNQHDQNHIQPSPLESSRTRIPGVQLLIILAPMSAAGHEAAIHSILRALAQPDANRWNISLLDDSGALIPFGQDSKQLTTALEEQAKHSPKPQYVGGSWLANANRAIQNLGIMPGRHVIIFASDYDSKLIDATETNPWLLRVGPSMFIDRALQAHAAMYTFQAAGPAVVVPFGGAAEKQYSGSGEQMASEINSQTINLGFLRSDLLYAAAETGGSAVNDIRQAFQKIEADTSGFYVIRFRPNIDEPDGALHPFTINTRIPGLQVIAARYYQAPARIKAAQLPERVREALKSRSNSPDLALQIRAWSFPEEQNGAYTVAFAASLKQKLRSLPSQNQSFKVKIFAELVNNSLGMAVGSWYDELFPSPKSRPNSAQAIPLYWRKEVNVHPGFYTLAVVVFDDQADEISSASFRFLAHPFNGQEVMLSDVVLSDRCLSKDEQIKRHRNLLAPLFWNDCELAPSITNSFTPDQNLTIFLRIYPTNERLTKSILDKWKARVVIFDEQNHEKSISLSITPAEVRGLIVSTKLRPESVDLPVGKYRMVIVFDPPNSGGKKPMIAREATFSLVPKDK